MNQRIDRNVIEASNMTRIIYSMFGSTWKIEVLRFQDGRSEIALHSCFLRRIDIPWFTQALIQAIKDVEDGPAHS